MIHFGLDSQPSMVATSSQQTVRPVRDQPNEKLALSRDQRSNSQSSLPSPDLPLPPRFAHERDDSSFSIPLSAASTSPSVRSRREQYHPDEPLATPTMSPPSSGHSRGASYTVTQRLSGNLKGKKSLPDLRLSHAKILKERRNEDNEAENTRHLGVGIERSKSNIGLGGTVWDSNPSAPAPLLKSNRAELASRTSADMLNNITKSPAASDAVTRVNGEGRETCPPRMIQQLVL